ncbi:putative intracellular protease/amidase [Chitinophaga terrae (ex Kim and Jung 2007)]|uniref:type 1 glutamine amidotransferase domain-containing protein n=1 Tax=Chitinophaga terrae (ex Kim and Jung 2007) TaxID=408074 RepID=UPI00278935BB|nr:type 1 glutamine amidotransferase domain-containing protein [Chitinophaga terrae (ex Kim and Jung 2007)]MDQ0106070.1 putative intracellular protease/amidase [Chitinophaga terrae (ex Kim and Jung 2007)]
MKNIAKIVLAAWILLSAIPGYAQQSTIKKSKMKHKKILFVLSSANKTGTTGEVTGTWIEEFSSPYYYLLAKGADITIATPAGGAAPVDPKSQQPAYVTESVKKFNSDKAARQQLNNTRKLADINPADYDAVFYPGGHGPTWDLPQNEISISIIESFYAQGKPVALVCHGPAALVNTKAPNGEPLVKGKKVSAFTNSEEQAGQTTAFVPFPLEDRLKELGALYQRGADWQPFAVADGALITGQNPASATEVAELLYQALSK